MWSSQIKNVEWEYKIDADISNPKATIAGGNTSELAAMVQM